MTRDALIPIKIIPIARPLNSGATILEAITTERTTTIEQLAASIIRETRRIAKVGLTNVGQHFILESNHGPFKLFKMLFSEMINQQERERTGRMLAEATPSNIKIMDYVLQRAVQRGEITTFPPKATKLILFEQIRYTYMFENGLVSHQKLEEIVDHVVLPAILYFSKL
ncbi:hypothetical protein PAECIP111890_01720 [Paenibacillus sp. JJ-223]|nr:hypothetical protein [Paenibacillus sp. JJ-223]CAH1199659.1 hypothetical protein PAECIP111890_01720 [Paenibacillus sp. JJ-223]